MTAHYEVRGAVAVITLDNPPVNGLGYATRVGITDGLARAQADAAVTAIVVTGAGKAFSGGADIREFGTPQALAEPNLLSVILALEASTKPVVAAIHSVCMGGGLELSLGCHYRVAASHAQVALPEVKIGLVPGAGGTQRLPRVLGLETALNMIVSGEPVKSELLASAPGQKLFDKLIEGDLAAGAVAFAAEVAERHARDKSPLPLVRNLKVQHPNADAYLQFTRNTVGAMSRNFPAPLQCVEAVAASVRLPFDAGMRKEREIFTALMFTPECKALRHAFFAERAASKIPDVPADTKLREVKKVAMIGAGTMGGGIAMNFLNAGIPVVMLEMKQDALDRGVATMRKNYEAQVRKGKLKEDKYAQRMALLSTTLAYDDLRDADMVIEAVFEDIGVKEQVFKQLDAVMKPGAILASNTSTLDVNAIAAFTKRPQDVIGTHFFSPANVMRLLEVVRGEKTAKDVLATVMALGKKIRKTCVVSGVCDGFIGNRMMEGYAREAERIVLEGATPRQVDAALESWGMAMGILAVFDMAGIDVGVKVHAANPGEYPADPAYYAPDKALHAAGRLGQKTGKGYYRYVPGDRTRHDDPEALEIIRRTAEELGIEQRTHTDEEIIARCLYPLLNEGIRILEEGVALRPADVDVVWTSGYGFPRWRGGPMFYADTIGLKALRDGILAFREQFGPMHWEPAALLTTLVEQGKTLSQWHAERNGGVR